MPKNYQQAQECQCDTINNMANGKKLFWLSFIGGIAVVAAIFGFLYLKQSSKIEGLAKLFPDWVLVEGKATNFTARFPKNPEYITQELPIQDLNETVKQEVFSLENENLAYFVSASKYPVSIPGEEEDNLRMSLDGILGTVTEGKVLSSKIGSSLVGKKFLDFEIQNSADNTFFKGRLFIDGDKLFQITFSYGENSYNDNAYSYFINSFKVK